MARAIVSQSVTAAGASATHATTEREKEKDSYLVKSFRVKSEAKKSACIPNLFVLT